jgi:transposase
VTIKLLWPVGAAAELAAARTSCAVIHVDAVWMAVEPLDMRAGSEVALARVVTVFGTARPHYAYLAA